MDYLPYFINEDIYLLKTEKSIAPAPLPEEKIIQKAEPVAPAETALAYQGKNLKKILVLTCSEEADFLTEPEQAFLEKILQALQLNFEDVAIVNVIKINKDTVDKINRFDCRYMISFGVTNAQMPVNSETSFYEVFEQEKITYLLADPLLTIEGDQHKKRKLWNALKKLFSV